MKKRHPHKTNVLLVNITRLGDMLQATPTIAGIKQENPDCKVTVLVEKQFEEVCHWIPNIDRVESLDLGMTVRSLAREQDGIVDAFEYVRDFVSEMRTREFDYCLNMSSSAYTALLLRLIGIERNGGWTSDEEGFRVISSEWAQLFASSVFHQNREFNSLNLVDIFRCSADVEEHPEQLLINVEDEALAFADQFISEAGFKNTGPLVAVQAGASQAKRQWSPARFARFIDILVGEHNARIVLTGSKKELPVLESIVEQCQLGNVALAAGQTSIPQLAGLLKRSEVLVTGDTGPMHVSVAVGTPVISMFLASAYGFETGPYSAGNLVLQPVIGCGPCNPNKACARPDCHDNIEPELLAALTIKRTEGDFRELPQDWVDPNDLIVYRSTFDQFGFCDLEPLTPADRDPWHRYREAYRKLWLDDLGGFNVQNGNSAGALNVVAGEIEGLEDVLRCSEKGQTLIGELRAAIKDTAASPERLKQVSEELSALDREIEQIGFHFAPLGPVTRMFVFGKENLSGSDADQLASQMGRVYEALKRRCEKLSVYYQQVA